LGERAGGEGAGAVVPAGEGRGVEAAAGVGEAMGVGLAAVAGAVVAAAVGSAAEGAGGDGGRPRHTTTASFSGNGAPASGHCALTRRAPGCSATTWTRSPRRASAALARPTPRPVTAGVLAAASATSRSNSWIDAGVWTVTAAAGTGAAAGAQASGASISSTAGSARRANATGTVIRQRIDGSKRVLNQRRRTTLRAAG